MKVQSERMMKYCRLLCEPDDWGTSCAIYLRYSNYEVGSNIYLLMENGYLLTYPNKSKDQFIDTQRLRHNPTGVGAKLESNLR